MDDGFDRSRRFTDLSELTMQADFDEDAGAATLLARSHFGRAWQEGRQDPARLCILAECRSRSVSFDML